MAKEDMSSVVFNTLSELRDGYIHDLLTMRDPDDECILIINSKVIAIEQAIQELQSVMMSANG